MLADEACTTDAQALKHVKSMKLVEGCYAAKEMALDKINALIAIVEQSESQKEASQAPMIGRVIITRSPSAATTANTSETVPGSVRISGEVTRMIVGVELTHLPSEPPVGFAQNRRETFG